MSETGLENLGIPRLGQKICFWKFSRKKPWHLKNKFFDTSRVSSTFWKFSANHPKTSETDLEILGGPLPGQKNCFWQFSRKKTHDTWKIDFLIPPGSAASKALFKKFLQSTQNVWYRFGEPLSNTLGLQKQMLRASCGHVKTWKRVVLLFKTTTTTLLSPKEMFRYSQGQEPQRPFSRIFCKASWDHRYTFWEPLPIMPGPERHFLTILKQKHFCLWNRFLSTARVHGLRDASRKFSAKHTETTETDCENLLLPPCGLKVIFWRLFFLK